MKPESIESIADYWRVVAAVSSPLKNCEAHLHSLVYVQIHALPTMSSALLSRAPPPPPWGDSSVSFAAPPGPVASPTMRPAATLTPASR
jgi:hypothetical protein